jgi:hypothetical protein|tara:strand:- start:6330 stop:6713 length:384 start_codon:yes stop_codon:yes gene_type:complete
MIEIKIDNSKSKVIEQYYTLVNPLLGKNKLGPVQLKVLAKMALVYNNYIHLGEDVANMLLFRKEASAQIREAVSKDLGTSFNSGAYSHILFGLRGRGFITKTKILYLPPIKDKKIEINIRLTIVEDE